MGQESSFYPIHREASTATRRVQGTVGTTVRHRAIQESRQGAIQESRQGAIQESRQGAIQESRQGASSRSSVGWTGQVDNHGTNVMINTATSSNSTNGTTERMICGSGR